MSSAKSIVLQIHPIFPLSCLPSQISLRKKLARRFVMVVFFGLVITSPVLPQYAQMNFPLHVGDYWQFSEVPGIVSEAWVIGDTVFPGGLKYTRLGGTLLGGYYRIEGTKLFRLIGGEILIGDFAGRPGDSLGFYRWSTDTTIVTVRDQGLWYCFTDLRFQMRFLHQSKHSPGIIRAQYQIADSIGFVAMDWETVHYRIVGAVINGRKSGVITSVPRMPPYIPTQSRLLQNYPNPFNPSTTISYALPRPANVTLRIFNTLGQEVALLVDGWKAAGTHQATWNASVPSGIYFYRIKTDEFIETKKMMMLK